MIQASLLEQINLLFKILTNNSKIGILGISILVLLFILLMSSKFHNKKITKIIYAIIYLGTFGTLIYFFHNEILQLFDYLINNIFLFLFFPNLAVYVLVLVIVNVIIVKSTFSNKESKLTKILNITCFIIFNVIFYLIIDNVIKNNVNVYEQLSIYTNNELLVLVELSMKLFVVWLLCLGIMKLSINLANSSSLAKATNKNLLLIDNNNQFELQNVNTVDDTATNNLSLNPIVEITEIPEKEEKETFDFVPIKKQMRKLTDKFRVKEVSNDLVTNLEEIKPIETTLTEVVSKTTPFDELNFDNKDTIILEDNESEQPKITLSSYDSIFKDENLELDTNINNNMEVVFDGNNNYLKNILFDIETLKDNCNDEKKIEKIYHDVQANQNELTLSDYNYLINSLIALKK